MGYVVKPDTVNHLKRRYRSVAALHREVQEKFGINLSQSQFGNAFWQNSQQSNLHYAMVIADCLGIDVEDAYEPPTFVIMNRHIRGEEAVVAAPEYDLEGRRVQRSTAMAERSPKNRQAAIDAQGTTCVICGFSYEKYYGRRGKGYIQVHHRTPVSQGERRVDPRNDMVVLCANCHVMIHADFQQMLTPEQLREYAPLFDGDKIIIRGA